VGTAEEIGRTVRLATVSWDRTARLCVLLVVAALAGAAFYALRQLPLIMW
jgi:hypothetical protein